jgi:hypothetical protein
VIGLAVTRRPPMKERPAPTTQLRLTMPIRCTAELSTETERQLVAALADLLVAVATHGEVARKGERDEREDP